MRSCAIFMLCIGAAIIGACATTAMVETANLTTPESRQAYIASNPASPNTQHIKNGEIAAGMSIEEVIASWGTPNVYINSRAGKMEHWIYYIPETDSDAFRELTLTFRGDTLRTWVEDAGPSIEGGFLSPNDPRSDQPTETPSTIPEKH
ncbi:MAG: hypothetical protein PHD74_05280 [Candidatus Krumholzibacteria bacterium]|nr:hypothetical protein [Candidatus Krumholzibacteria bacterium]